MRFKIAITAPYMQPIVDRFIPYFNERGIEVLVPKVEERCEEEDLLKFIGDIDGLICGDDRVTPRVLDHAKKLKVISKWGTGIDSIDKEACSARGVALCNTPNAFSEPVADSVYAYMLSFARNTPWMDTAMKKGVWFKIPSRSLRESTLGIIGLGDVGKAVARRAAGFGLTLLGNDVKEVSADFVKEVGIKLVSKEELLQQSDFVSLNTDLNKTSFHLMSDREFEIMKPTAVLINTSRGPVVDEQALIKALQSKKIAGAGLDVFEHEPLPATSPLLKMDNVLTAPHNSNSSPMAWEKVHTNTINNLMNVLEKADK